MELNLFKPLVKMHSNVNLFSLFILVSERLQETQALPNKPPRAGQNNAVQVMVDPVSGNNPYMFRYMNDGDEWMPIDPADPQDDHSNFEGTEIVKYLAKIDVPKDAMTLDMNQNKIMTGPLLETPKADRRRSTGFGSFVSPISLDFSDDEMLVHDPLVTLPTRQPEKESESLPVRLNIHAET